MLIVVLFKKERPTALVWSSRKETISPLWHKPGDGLSKLEVPDQYLLADMKKATAAREPNIDAV
jgi:hypothetical protein